MKLTCLAILFEFGSEQIKAQKDLKQAIITSSALKPLDYISNLPVILSVDTSFIVVGYFLCQQLEENPKIHHYNHFGSITLNIRESRYSQAKLEIYELFQAMRVTRL